MVCGAHDADERLVEHSGKLQLADQLLRGLHKRGHRVLIFTQMTSVRSLGRHKFPHAQPANQQNVGVGTDAGYS